MLLSDGPAGVRGERWDERDTSLSLPSPTALAASWDEGLVERLGALLAQEARRKDVDVLLAPGVNLHRSPLGGRNFEYFSEDPVLSGRIGAAYVRGVQAGGVAATVKHYVANESETDRMTVDARVDERTLREVYLAPFEHVWRAAAPWAFMAAYNRVNGTTMTESPLLAEPLKGEWGFDGVVMSDWTATRSTDAAGRAALDLTMPGPNAFWGDALADAVLDGRVPETAIDEKVRRLLRLAARVGALEGTAPAVASPPAPRTPHEAAELLREASAAGTVLVRNEDGVLPLHREGLRRVALLGPNAATARTQGGGSATVHPDHVVSPLEGITAALGADVEVVHAVGARIRRGLDPVGLRDARDPVSGEPGLRVRYLEADGTPIADEHRLTGRLGWLGERVLARAGAIEVEALLRVEEPGRYAVGVGGVGPFRLEADGEVLVDEDIPPEPGSDPFAAFLDPPQRSAPLDLDPGREVALRVRHEITPGPMLASLTLGMAAEGRPPEEELERAVRAAASADVAIVVVGTTEAIESEGFDRRDLALPGAQDELVRRVAAANPRTVVVVNAGAPVILPWRDEVPATLLTWFGGQEFGGALASVLLGEVEPSGRLPTTWPGREEDVPVLSTTPVDGAIEYAEGLNLGYRAWAWAGATPAWPFGHGLGYTTWDYTRAHVAAPPSPDGPARVSVALRNTGPRFGREVVQAYLTRPDSALARPPFWLAGFAVVQAGPGEETHVALELPARAFAHWAGKDGWQIEGGEFEVLVGPSAAQHPLRASIEAPTCSL
jgi:beta-glucosidase